MKQKVFRAGNSLVVVVPSSFTKLVGVREGDDVKVKQQPEKGRLVYTFRGVKQLRLAD